MRYTMAPGTTEQMFIARGFVKIEPKPGVFVLEKETNLLYEDFDSDEYKLAKIWVHNRKLYWSSIYVGDSDEGEFIQDLIDDGLVLEWEE